MGNRQKRIPRVSKEMDAYAGNGENAMLDQDDTIMEVIEDDEDDIIIDDFEDEVETDDYSSGSVSVVTRPLSSHSEDEAEFEEEYNESFGTAKKIDNDPVNTEDDDDDWMIVDDDESDKGSVYESPYYGSVYQNNEETEASELVSDLVPESMPEISPAISIEETKEPEETIEPKEHEELEDKNAAASDNAAFNNKPNNNNNKKENRVREAGRETGTLNHSNRSIRAVIADALMSCDLDEHIILTSALAAANPKKYDIEERPKKLNSIEVGKDFKSVSEVLKAFSGLEDSEYVVKKNGRWQNWAGIDQRTAEILADHYISNFGCEDIVISLVSKYVCENSELNAWIKEKREDESRMIAKQLDLMLQGIYGKEDGQFIAGAEYIEETSVIRFTYRSQTWEYRGDVMKEPTQKLEGSMKTFTQFKDRVDSNIIKRQVLSYETVAGHSPDEDGIPQRDIIREELNR